MGFQTVKKVYFRCTDLPICIAPKPPLCLISNSALYLIHSSSCCVEGNAADLADRLALLQKTDERISQLYAVRSGGEAEKFAEVMAENGGRGRWLSPDEAVELGLADICALRKTPSF